MLSQTIEHLVHKGNQLERKRPKLPYGHGRGGVSVETEVRKEYTAKNGERGDQMKTPDNINFGKERFLKTTTKGAFGDTRDDPIVKLEHDKTQMLGGHIKKDGRGHKEIDGREDHPEKFAPKAKPNGENNAKPDAWIRGKLDKTKDLAFNPHTTFKDHYNGHNDNYAEKQNERFDNLKCTGPICRDNTEYREKHHAKTPDITASREMFSHNKYKGKTGHLFLANPDTLKNTTYNVGFNETLKTGDLGGKPHFGKDDQTKEFLYQHHHGYYYTDDK